LGKLYKGWSYEELWNMTDAERDYFFKFSEEWARLQEKAMKGKK
jgi:hypothetical protein